MDKLTDYIYKFIKKEWPLDFLAFLIYVLYIAGICITLDFSTEFILFFITTAISIIYIQLSFCNYFEDISKDYYFLEKKEKFNRVFSKIKAEFRKIAKEILKFIPIIIVNGIVTSLVLTFVNVNPENETNINELLIDSPIKYSLLCIIIAPIEEELIFRLLPSKFIKKKIPYIFISAIIFAALHVINDPNAFYYVFVYMIDSLYYSYRYYKTKDIWVTISLHSLNNLIAVLTFFC